MDTSLGRRDYLLDARDEQGRPVISVMNTATVYRRADGSLYIILEGRRATLREDETGALSLVTHNMVPVNSG